jgi:zinc D-Ala-D-Ala carboxypeptidase
VNLQKGMGLVMNQPPKHIENFKKLALKVFQPIRSHFGAYQSHISSGYRSAELNKFIKGSATSQHCSGEAIDIDMDGTTITNKQVFDFIKTHLKFDQLIWEFGTDKNPDWVHVSYDAEGIQRNQVLKAIKKSRKTTYVPYS